MGMTEWWVAAGGLLLLLVLGAGAWLVTVIVRRSNDRSVDTDTQPLEFTPGPQPPEDPPQEE